jgi:hypothetical protein
MIQIAYLCVKCLTELNWNNGENVDVRVVSEDDWTLMLGVRVFAEILSGITVPASDGKRRQAPIVPILVSKTIEQELFANSRIVESLGKMFVVPLLQIWLHCRSERQSKRDD